VVYVVITPTCRAGGGGWLGGVDAVQLRDHVVAQVPLVVNGGVLQHAAEMPHRTGTPPSAGTPPTQRSADPLILAFEPSEDRWRCYADELLFDAEGAPQAPSHC